MCQKKRFVTTGIGVALPIGTEADVFWNNLFSEKIRVFEILKFDATGLPCKIAAEAKDFYSSKYLNELECNILLHSYVLCARNSPILMGRYNI